MTPTERQRIEKEADLRASKWLEVQYTAAKNEYIAGSTEMYNRMAFELKAAKSVIEFRDIQLLQKEDQIKEAKEPGY